MKRWLSWQVARRKLVMLLGGVLGVAGALGAANPAGGRVMLALHNHLATRLTSPEKGRKVDISIATYEKEEEAARGRFKSVAVRGAPVQLKNIEMKDFDLRAEDVVVDVKKLLEEDDLETSKSKKTFLQATISEDALTKMMAQGKHTANMGITVRFRNNRMHITGNLKIFAFSGPFNAVGRIVLKGGRYADLDLESLQIYGVGAPEAVMRKLEEKVNPVLKFESVPFGPVLKSLKYRGSTLVLSTEEK